ncbi:COG3650 family protein [Aurantiacibacter sediminis]|uniref:Lipoprotein n=1 Tax=Aurantiacibacter sediminis TaxID=2793064 RepID=A0ABS0N1R6_9SPHN|nr:hypothetical protein [Aurantiacibacter sediminis]MBH5321887.1 hypothetical protein [Aurantiacibacter sediminis]
MKLSLAVLPIALTLAACSGGDNANVPGNAENTEPYSEIAEDQVINLIGTEPFWGAIIDGDDMNFSTLENPEGETIAVTRFAGRGGLSFSGEREGASVDVAVTPGECSDGMSDHTYPFTATVEIGEDQLQGCAWREGVDDIGPETDTAEEFT